MTFHPNKTTPPPPTPPNVPISTIKIATLNINGITARTRVGMLADFIRRHHFDIIFTQEVTSMEVMNVRGYNAYLNIGASIRGTAIPAKSTLHLTNITTLPPGRTIAADYKGIRLINYTHRQGQQGGPTENNSIPLSCHIFFTAALPISLLGVISTAYYTQ